MNKYTYIGEHCVDDPDYPAGENPVHMEVFKDNDSGGIFAVDSSFLEQNSDFFNVFNGDEDSIELLPES
jgi:hypothetical protein